MNIGRCRACGEILASRSRHDFQACGCGASFVDGGDDYCRAGGEFEPFTKEQQAKLAEHQTRGLDPSEEPWREADPPIFRAFVERFFDGHNIREDDRWWVRDWLATAWRACVNEMRKR